MTQTSREIEITGKSESKSITTRHISLERITHEFRIGKVIQQVLSSLLELIIQRRLYARLCSMSLVPSTLTSPIQGVISMISFRDMIVKTAFPCHRKLALSSYSRHPGAQGNGPHRVHMCRSYERSKRSCQTSLFR